MYAFRRAGVPVFLPWGGGLPYDLMLDLGDRFVRVQVKSGRLRGEVIVFKTCSTDHGRGARDHRGRADVLAVHCAELDEVFVIPVHELPRHGGSLRTAPTRNNQRRRVRYADDCTVDRWLARVCAG